MITFDEVARILAKCAAYDQRTVGEGDIRAWHEALNVAEPPIEIEDALISVARFYAERTEGRIRPAHVIEASHAMDLDRRQRARDEIRDRALERATEARAVEVVGTRDRADEVNQLLDDLRRRIGPRARPEVFRRPEWLRSDRARDAASVRRRVDPSGLGWCVECHRAGRMVLAVDPDAGSECREHSTDAPPGPREQR